MEVERLDMQQHEQQIPCLAQALLFDLDCDSHLHHQRVCSYDEVNVYLCLTCGSPVFRDDDEQESDLTSPFCLDCFSMFQSRDSDGPNDISMIDVGADDDEHDTRSHFHVSCPALEGPTGFGFLTGSNATVSAA